jgi:hypothetical protein
VILGQSTATTKGGIALGGETPGTYGLDNDGNRVENCAVRRAQYGIFSAGFDATNPNSGTVITRNDLAGSGAEALGRAGIIVFHEDGIEISENRIGGMLSSGPYDLIGIGGGAQSLDTSQSASDFPVTNVLIARNRIDGIALTSPSGASAAGIVVAGGAAGPNTVVNNMISGVIAPANPANLVAGIHVVGAAGSTTRVFHNTVALAGDRGTSAQNPSFALSVTGLAPALVLRNNVLANTQTASGGAGAKSYAIGLATSDFGGLDSDGNDFFAAGANAGWFRTGSLVASAGTDYATLAAWSAAVADDAASLEVDPLLVSATDLHLQAASPMLDAGLALPAVTDDFDGEPRPPVAPDIGADEIVTPLGPDIFADGFETGDFSRWSVTVPGGFSPFAPARQ